jgi:predicted glutamine amidotransferase
MHNGDIGDFARVRRPLLNSLSDDAFDSIHGNTDSEHLFGLVIDELAQTNSSGAEHLAAAMQAAVARIVELCREHGQGEHSYLNLALSDGESAVACRFTTEPGYDGESLFVHTGRVYVCHGGVCRMLSPERGRGCVLVSSEPLSEDPGWDPLPRNSIVVVSKDGTIDVRSMQ